MKKHNFIKSTLSLFKRSRRNVVMASSMCTAIVFMSNGCLPFKAVHMTDDLFSEASAPLDEVGGQKFTCDSPQLRGMTEGKIRRLTRVEVENTLRDIFGDEAVDRHVGALGLYAQDGSDVDNFRQQHNGLAVQAIYSVSAQISESVVSRANEMSLIAPGCLFSSSNNIPSFDLSNDSCNRGFISNLGLKILRRPLSNEEVNNLNTILNSDGEMFGNAGEKISFIVQDLLLRPEFVFHMSRVQGKKGSRMRVDQYTVASRLSYRLTGSLPDAQLFAAAAAGELTNTQKMWPHAVRLLDSARGRSFVRSTFYRWLELGSISDARQVYLDHMNINRDNLKNDLAKEALDFVEYIFFQQRGSFKDLIESPAAFPPSDAVAKIMNTGKSDGIDDPQFSTDGRIGLYQRPALLVSPETRTSPIHRGYHFISQFMCQKIPEPSGVDIQEGNDRLAQIDRLSVSARVEATHVTSPTRCAACHDSINPPGFVFENFGPVGEVRNIERIFDAQGNYLRDIDVDTVVEGIFIDGSPRTARDPASFSRDLASSFEAKTCYSQQMFRLTRYLVEETADSCQLAELESSLNLGRSLFDTFIRSAASEDILWERKRY